MPARFSLSYRLIHWAMAAIVLTMLVFGQRFGWPDLPEGERRFSLAAHATLGVMVIGLLAIRLWMRATGRARRPVHPLPPWQRIAAGTVQTGLYALLIFLPITGLLTALHHDVPVRVLGVFDISGGDKSRFAALRMWHEIGTRILALLVVIHIAAALMHRFIRRDGVFASMALPLRRPRR